MDLQGEVHVSTPRLKLVETEIDSENPWSDDVLKRSVLAQHLTTLVASETGSLVLSLNGAWGSGKTFFLKRWQAQLKGDDFEAIYFNAWEDDYCGEPLIALIGQLWATLQGTSFDQVAKAVKERAKSVLTDTIFNAVRTSTLGVVDLQQDQLRSIGEQAVEGYLHQRKERDDLTASLKKLANDVQQERGKPLVFIVDELDRCRPTFAIEMLERIKHLFSIPNIVFVLGVDRHQLESSIRSVYGEIDVDGYLRRFFDLDLALPAPDRSSYCTILLEKHGVGAFLERLCANANTRLHTDEYTHFCSFFPFLCNMASITLRDVEHCVRSFVLAIRGRAQRQYMYPRLLATLIVLRVKNYRLYRELILGRCRPSQVIDYFCPGAANELASDFDGSTLMEFEIELYLTDSKEGEEVVAHQLQLLADDQSLTNAECIANFTRSRSAEQLKRISRWYNHFLQQRTFGASPSKSTLKLLHDRIEWAANLTNGAR